MAVTEVTKTRPARAEDTREMKTHNSLSNLEQKGWESPKIGRTLVYVFGEHLMNCLLLS
jgi:hypothetical protein